MTIARCESNQGLPRLADRPPSKSSLSRTGRRSPPGRLPWQPTATSGVTLALHRQPIPFGADLGLRGRHRRTPGTTSSASVVVTGDNEHARWSRGGIGRHLDYGSGASAAPAFTRRDREVQLVRFSLPSRGPARTYTGGATSPLVRPPPRSGVAAARPERSPLPWRSVSSAPPRLLVTCRECGGVASDWRTPPPEER